MQAQKQLHTPQQQHQQQQQQTKGGKQQQQKTKNGNRQETDHTLEYSSLLIAKPLPFAFDLCIRDQKRAEHVAKRWVELRMKGEFEDARCFWKGGNAGDKEKGWGKV